MGGSSRGEEQRADSLSLLGLCLFCKHGEGYTGGRHFFRGLVFLCFYFFPLEVAAIIITKDGGESRVVGTDLVGLSCSQTHGMGRVQLECSL